MIFEISYKNSAPTLAILTEKIVESVDYANKIENWNKNAY
jgi:hypothetical protein